MAHFSGGSFTVAVLKVDGPHSTCLPQRASATEGVVEALPCALVLGAPEVGYSVVGRRHGERSGPSLRRLFLTGGESPGIVTPRISGLLPARELAWLFRVPSSRGQS